MKIEKDKILHISVCFGLTIIFANITKLWIIAPLHAFTYFTLFKEFLGDMKMLHKIFPFVKISYKGTFDIRDIRANAIGSLLGGIVLCVYYLCF